MLGIRSLRDRVCKLALIAYYKASEAWVISNRDYTEEAKALAKSNGV